MFIAFFGEKNHSEIKDLIYIKKIILVEQNLDCQKSMCRYLTLI